MPRAERSATVVWEGNVARGRGQIKAGTGAFDVPFSLPTRVGESAGQTSPEELIAAAHGGCYAMALASELTQLERPPERLEVTCTVTLDEVEQGKHRIVSSALRVSAQVSGVDAAEFARAAQAAEEACPVSILLDTKITLDAKLGA